MEAHSRSDVGVAARTTNCDCRLQMVKISQTRSVLLVQGAFSYSSRVQLLQGLTMASLVVVHVVSTNSFGPCLRQSRQTRSLVAVAACISYWPVPHRVSSSHTRSVVTEGAAATNSSAVQL
jgi:hypothetical protein